MGKIVCEKCGRERLWFGNECRFCVNANVVDIILCKGCHEVMVKDEDEACGECKVSALEYLEER